MVHLPGSMAERFELGEELGSGSFGSVHLVRDRVTGACLALKQILLQGDGARERREIEASLRLRHPHVIRCLAGGIEGDRAYLLMERAEGSMADWIDEPDQRPRCWEGLLQAARGVGALHQLGLVHRDLKPANLLSVGRVVKVSDLGLAKGSDLETVTETGVILGTPDYMAPEQVRGETAHPAWDVFALGVLAYQILEGHLPVPEGALIERLHALQRGQLLPWRNVGGLLDPRSEALVRSALELDPARRPLDLEAWADELASLPPPATAPVPDPEKPLAGEATLLRGSAPTGAVPPSAEGALPPAAPERTQLAPPPPGRSAVQSTGEAKRTGWRARLPFLVSGAVLLLTLVLLGGFLDGGSPTPHLGPLPGAGGPSSPPSPSSPTGRALLGDRLQRVLRELEDSPELARLLAPGEEGGGGLGEDLLGPAREALVERLADPSWGSLLADLDQAPHDQDLARRVGRLALCLRLLAGLGSSPEGGGEGPTGAGLPPGREPARIAAVLEDWLLAGGRLEEALPPGTPGATGARGRWVELVPVEFETRAPRPEGPLWLPGRGVRGGLPEGGARRELESMLLPGSHGELRLRFSAAPGGPPWIPVIEVVSWSGVLEIGLERPPGGRAEYWSLRLPEAILPQGERALRLRLQGLPGGPAPSPLRRPHLAQWVGARSGEGGGREQAAAASWQEFFPEDYHLRVLREIRAAEGWIRDPRGRPDLMLPSGPLFLDTDFTYWGEQLQNLPELNRFYRWVARGGIPGKLPAVLQEQLSELDEAFASRGLPRPFAPFRDPHDEVFLPRIDHKGRELEGWVSAVEWAAVELDVVRVRQRRKIAAWRNQPEEHPSQPYPFELDARDELVLMSSDPSAVRFPGVLHRCLTTPFSRRSIAAWSYDEQEALLRFWWMVRRALGTPRAYGWEDMHRFWGHWREIEGHRVGSGTFFPPVAFLPPGEESMQAATYSWLLRKYFFEGRKLTPRGAHRLREPSLEELTHWLEHPEVSGPEAPAWGPGPILLAEILLRETCFRDHPPEVLDLYRSFLPHLEGVPVANYEGVVNELVKFLDRRSDPALETFPDWEDLWLPLLEQEAEFSSSIRKRIAKVEEKRRARFPEAG